MTPLQFTSKTVGTAESNISKWAKVKAQIVEKAAANVTRDLMKNHQPRARFPKTERELHVLFRAKRKRGLKVSTLWLCVTMTGLIKKLYRDDPRAKTFTPTWRYVGKWVKEFHHRAEEQLEKSERREALPKVVAGTHAEPGTSVSWVERGRCGGVTGITPPGVGKSGGAGSGGASGEGHAHADNKYGRFPLDRRVNVDQVHTRVEYFDLFISFVIIFVVSL